MFPSSSASASASVSASVPPVSFSSFPLASADHFTSDFPQRISSVADFLPPFNDNSATDHTAEIQSRTVNDSQQFNEFTLSQPVETSSAAAASSADPAPAIVRKRNSRKIACIVCHQAKTSCNGCRPCDRCVRISKSHLCVDRPSKVARSTTTTMQREERRESEEPELIKREMIETRERKRISHSNSINSILPSNSAPVPATSAASSAYVPLAVANYSSSNFLISPIDPSDQRGLSKFLLTIYKTALVKSEFLRISPDSDSLITFLAFLAELLHYDDFYQFLKFIGFRINGSQSNNLNARQWISPSALPQIPNRLLVDWSDSPAVCIPDGPLLSNFASLIISRSDEPAVEENHSIEAISVRFLVRVNHQFERLFGFSQHEVRSSFLSQGEKFLRRLIRSDGWENFYRFDMRKLFSGQNEYKSFVQAINKWNCEFPAFVHKRFVTNTTGLFKPICYTWIQMPQ